MYNWPCHDIGMVPIEDHSDGDSHRKLVVWSVHNFSKCPVEATI